MAGTDGFARGHFAARVIATLLFVAPLLLWWSAKDPGTVEKVTVTTGVVVEQNDRIALLELEDGRQVRVFVGRRRLAPGTEVELRAETFADGSQKFWPTGR
jgi:hypothetical protein